MPFPRPGRKPKPASPDWPRRFELRAQAARDSRLQSFYESGVVDPNTPLSETPFVSLDLETTGMDRELDSIVSIGLVPFTLARIHCRESRHWLLRPRRAFSEQSIVIHGITHDQINRAPDLLEVLEPLLGSLAGRVVLVHYRAIERPFLDRAVRTRLGEALEFPVVDTMEIEAGFHRSRKPGLIARVLGRQRVSIRLAACRSRYNLPRYRAHHALTDALATAELFQAQVAHRLDENMPIRTLWR